MIYSDVFYSTVKFCKDVITEMVNEGFASPTYIDWEDHPDIDELPVGDLLGVTSFTLGEDENTHDATAAIGVCTQDDPGLFRLRGILARLYDKLRSSSSITLYDLEQAAPIGVMTVHNGTHILPMTRADVRPLQFIQFAMSVDPEPYQ